MFVADTNVISISDPAKRPIEPAVAIDLDLIFLTTITIAEIHEGLARLNRIGAARKAADLALWWERVERLYDERILDFDIRAAHLAGQIADRAAAKGHDPGWADIQIASIAASHGYTVLTRNMRHFAPLGVPCLDPYSAG
ncbi:PIN domain-containing protein [Methylopila sp. M107]|uniref:PIN domain-containing protein n=1 Tax=Methylopila sp. M107 TaxID=1101190 RepID=UPI000377C6A1|nr:PIN domain-containing protein [Methylopila sp. M107]